METGPIEMTICWNCHAELVATAETCGQCGCATQDAGTSSRGPARELMNRPWVIILLMLHVGFLGIPVYWKTKYSLGARLVMILASIVYTIAAVTFIISMLRWIAGMFFG